MLTRSINKGHEPPANAQYCMLGEMHLVLSGMQYVGASNLVILPFSSATSMISDLTLSFFPFD
jgi:hypothetical protein